MLLCAAALIVVVCVIAMKNVDTSVAYHMVRGQSFIKLYVIINVLEVCACACVCVCMCVRMCVCVVCMRIFLCRFLIVCWHQLDKTHWIHFTGLP